MTRFSFRSLGFAALCAAALSACSGDYNVTEVRMIEPIEGTYYMALQQGYADVAQWKQNERNWDDSEILLGKARKAAAGIVPDLEPADTPALESVRQRLDDALGKVSPKDHPIDVALARTSYDCVAQSVENAPNPEGATGHNCWVTFLEALTTLEGIAALPSAPTEVHFEDGAITLSDAESAALKTLADAIKSANPSLVLISGFSNPKARLSDEIIRTQRRVTAVQNALTEAGVKADKIKQMVYDDQGTAPGSTATPSANGPLKQVTVTLVQ